MSGCELANGFHELGDSIEQRRRFEANCRDRQVKGLSVMMPDERLLAGLAEGLPDCSGVALAWTAY